jgi:hypothetical protein
LLIKRGHFFSLIENGKREGEECFIFFVVLFDWSAFFGKVVVSALFSFGHHGCNVDEKVLVCLISECEAASVILWESLLCCSLLVNVPIINLYMYTNI